MRYLIYLALMASMSVQAATIKKWVDEEGNVHYGDSPPLSVETENVHVLSAPSNPGKALPRLGNTGGDGAASGSASAGGQEQNKVPADQARIACEKAQEDLQVINRSSRIKLRSADGSTRYMTTEEIEERKAQAEADVKQFCK
jgi:hypothetical protein